MNANEVRAQNLRIFVRSQGIDLVGIADLHWLEGIPSASKTFMASILNNFQYAIVLGAQVFKPYSSPRTFRTLKSMKIYYL